MEKPIVGLGSSDNRLTRTEISSDAIERIGHLP